MQFHWINENRITEKDGRITIYAPAESDFFFNCGEVSADGITPMSLTNAPYYYTWAEGDFVFRARVSHGFQDVYDACALMVMHDMETWGKLCFENTDFDTHAVVSVVTRGLSDDANGVNLDGNEVWLQVVRKGPAFAFHYSRDGKHFIMTRFFHIPADEKVKVGLLAQAPVGKGGDRHFADVSLEHRTVANIRTGE